MFMLFHNYRKQMNDDLQSHHLNDLSPWFITTGTEGTTEGEETCSEDMRCSDTQSS